MRCNLYIMLSPDMGYYVEGSFLNSSYRLSWLASCLIRSDALNCHRVSLSLNWWEQRGPGCLMQPATRAFRSSRRQQLLWRGKQQEEFSQVVNISVKCSLLLESISESILGFMLTTLWGIHPLSGLRIHITNSSVSIYFIPVVSLLLLSELSF